MRDCLCVLTASLLIVACSHESPTTSLEQYATEVQSKDSYESAYARVDNDHPSSFYGTDDSDSRITHTECPPVLTPLWQTLPSLHEVEGQPLKRQSCGMNLAMKEYGPLNDTPYGPTVIYTIISYTRQYADLPTLSNDAIDEFLSQQRQGWPYLLESLREKVRWAEVPDIYTDHQIARLPRELLWHDSMPAVLDNGTGVWGLTIWVTPDVMASVVVHDETTPDPTADEALQRLTPLADALNFQKL